MRISIFLAGVVSTLLVLSLWYHFAFPFAAALVTALLALWVTFVIEWEH
jgi:hypothetical protein